jgi:hypothetical protein
MHFKIHLSRIYIEILEAGQRGGSFQTISKVVFIEETALLSQITIHNEKRRKKDLFIYFDLYI